MSKKTTMVAVLGPTASGKSGVAEFLAEKLPAELLNGDASAVYRELSVGVTKPDPETRARIPYHLLDVASLKDGFDLMQFLQMANTNIKEISDRGKLPILVGGSSLYTRALLDGYRPHSVEISPQLREAVRAMPLDAALNELKQRDEASFDRIDRDNPRRVHRALELAIAYDGPIPQPTQKVREDLSIVRVYLLPERNVLRERIRKRTEMMWEPWLEEVVELEKNGAAPWLEERKPIGYNFVISFLKGELTADLAKAKIVQQTVKLAKKQETWLKTEGEHQYSCRFRLVSSEDWLGLPTAVWQEVDKFLGLLSSGDTRG